MTLNEFVRIHRPALQLQLTKVRYVRKDDLDACLKLLVLNDDFWYNRAKQAGVRIWR